MWWKGKIPAGSKCDSLCSTIDILPTVAALIGAELPQHPIDGKDIRPLMFEEPGSASPHDAFCCYYGNGELQAIRNERFKLVFPHTYRTLKGHPGGIGGLPIAYKEAQISLSLYDLDNDISEKRNVLNEFPDVVHELSEAAERARADLGDRLTGREGSGARAIGKLSEGDERLPLVWR
jgi:arylsulfatase A-like enzyme